MNVFLFSLLRYLHNWFTEFDGPPLFLSRLEIVRTNFILVGTNPEIELRDGWPEGLSALWTVYEGGTTVFSCRAELQPKNLGPVD